VCVVFEENGSAAAAAPNGTEVCVDVGGTLNGSDVMVAAAVAAGAGKDA
jgi:hypothetical protein